MRRRSRKLPELHRLSLDEGWSGPTRTEARKKSASADFFFVQSRRAGSARPSQPAKPIVCTTSQRFAALITTNSIHATQRVSKVLANSPINERSLVMRISG